MGRNRQKKVRTEKNRIREVRRILTGRFSFAFDGSVIVAAPDLLHAATNTYFPGSDSAHFLGVRTLMRQYRFRGNAAKTYDACVAGFLRVGTRAHLYTAPDALAIFCRPRMRHPSLVTLEGQDDMLLLSVYTARSLFAALNQKALLRRLEEELPPVSSAPVSLTPQCVDDADALEGTYAGRFARKNSGRHGK